MIFLFKLFKERKELIMSKIGLIIKREYSSRVRKRSFIVITVLVPLLIAALGFLAMWISIQDSKQLKVLVSDPGNLCDGKVFVGDNPNPPAIFYFFQDDIHRDDFQTQERFQEYDVLLGVHPNVITNRAIKGFYREKPSVNSRAYIRNRIELRLEEYFALDKGLSLGEYRKIRQEFGFELVNIDEAQQDTTNAQIVGFIFSIFIFIFILIYAGQVMRGVIEEKTSRVVEILVSSVKPIQLMMGKIIGIGLVGLTQFLIWIGLIAITLFLMRSFVFQDLANPANLAEAMESLNGASSDLLSGQAAAMTKDSELIFLIYNGIPWGDLLLLFMLYFVGGYLLYGSLFAMIGSAVDSETDTQQVMVPVMMPLMFSYIIGITIMNNPGGPAAIWFSQIPFSSPIIMLQRVAAGTVDLWEVIISLLLLTSAFILTLWAAGKVYRTGILMYGKKASWKEIFKWLRY